MYRLALVEDDAAQAKLLVRMIERHPRSDELAITCLSGASDLESFVGEGTLPDILLMDIVLNDSEKDGIELVQRFAPEGCGTQVVYITGHIEYCTKVYQTEHVYFLTKPVAQCDFTRALDKALANLDQMDSRPVGLQVGSSVVTLSPRKISYIESARRKVLVHQEGKVIEAYASLTGLSQQLPASFVRCHKGFLVNMNYIKELQATDIQMTDGILIPLSQRRRAAVREAFIAHLQGRR